MLDPRPYRNVQEHNRNWQERSRKRARAYRNGQDHTETGRNHTGTARPCRKHGHQQIIRQLPPPSPPLNTQHTYTHVRTPTHMLTHLVLERCLGLCCPLCHLLQLCPQGVQLALVLRRSLLLYRDGNKRERKVVSRVKVGSSCTGDCSSCMYGMSCSADRSSCMKAKLKKDGARQ